MKKPTKALKLKGGKRYFSEFVARQSDVLNAHLPLAHLTDAYDLRDILKDNEIKNRHCPTFDQDLSYCFYG